MPALASATVAGVPFAISVGVFLENRIDRTAPRAGILRQQLLRRRGAARDTLLQRFEIARLVASIAVEKPAPLQAGLGQSETLLGKLAHRSSTDRRLQRLRRHIVTQLLPLF